MDTGKFGDQGESYAASLLQAKGYTILDRNFRTKVGEIDIIALDDDTLVFVEVKSRKSSRFGAPVEAVNARKLARVKRAGEYYSLTHPKLPKRQRIDVVAIEARADKVVSAKIIKVF
jgi:putative endonuclease